MSDAKTCNEMRARMADWLDEELSPAIAERVEEHLSGCEECRAAFAKMQAMGGDLAMLGRAAERIAEGAALGVRRVRVWKRSWARAAAVVALFVVGGLYFAIARYTPVTQPVLVQQTPLDDPIEIRSATVREPDAAPTGDCQVAGHTAVALASGNPRVRIVWLFEDGASDGSTNSGGGLKPRPQG